VYVLCNTLDVYCIFSEESPLAKFPDNFESNGPNLPFSLISSPRKQYDIEKTYLSVTFSDSTHSPRNNISETTPKLELH
jgi:hypothetical protein